MQREELLKELQQLIADECERDVDPASIDLDAPLIGRDSQLDLDSLDALQIALAVGKRYGKPIKGSKETRAVLRSLNTLADFVLGASATKTSEAKK